MLKALSATHSRLETSLFYPSAAASSLALGLVIGQTVMNEEIRGAFLVWNLFLAWIPYLMALWAERSAQHSLWKAILPGILWLLFLPNAPYLMTDLIHLQRLDFVWWYDLSTLLAFAWSGCLLGVASLHIMQQVVSKRMGVAMGWVFVLVSCGLSGLGVYFGRFLRWNSWDIVFSPRGLAHELLHLLSNPAHYPQMIGVSGIFACFLGLGYLTLIAARRI